VQPKKVWPSLFRDRACIRELENFKAKPILATKDATLDWREGQHDDMVLAVALAAWFGEATIPAYVPREYDPYFEAQLRAIW
jgi:hypothetical protein